MIRSADRTRTGAPAAASDLWWQTPPAPPDLQQGLSSAQVATLLQQWGPNRFVETRTPPVWLQFIGHFRNPLVLILLVASTLSALLGEFTNFIINVIVLLSVTLDFAQEHRAQRAAEMLRQSIALSTRVLREGTEQSNPLTELVPGDLVLLKAGDLVPADGIVIEARDCFVNQSVLTGESGPSEKRIEMHADASDIQSATHAMFMGSSVLSGSAKLLIVRTGAATEMGSIAGHLGQPATLTAFDIGTRRFNALIMRLTMLMVLVVLLMSLLSHKPWAESFLFALALAVGLTPELLPMVVSVTLARGALRMAREKVIVKRQTAISDLGAMDVLCTDKTGTLTEAKISMQSHVDAIGADSARVLELAYLNSWFESGLHNPMDVAILEHETIDTRVWRKIDEVPFDFERRRVSVLLEKNSVRTLVVKGAPAEVLRACLYYENAGNTLLLDDAAFAKVRATCDALEDEGFRVLAIASKAVPPDHPHAVVDDESALVLTGFAAFLDPPKASAADTLRALATPGISIKVLTGDSERVTQHIFHALQLPIEAVVLGSDIEKLDDIALQALTETANLFCRLNPSQKSRVIDALRARSHVVAYLGDGINDAPSLRAADVGLSVDTAVDIAKAAADIILLQKDLKVLQLAVLEGRRTVGNVMKYLMMGTSSNFGNMFSMAGAALFLPFLPMKPVQILLNNILYDLSEVAIPFDAVDNAELNRPLPLDISLVRDFMWVIGPVSSAFDLITFWILPRLFNANEALFQTGWFIESLCTQVLVIFVIRTRGNPLRSRPHPLLIASSITVVLLAIVLPYTTPGAYFGFTPPPVSFFGVLLLLLISYLFVVESTKQRFFRHRSSMLCTHIVPRRRD
ncbi:MAG: magnesium-translocating P-type ATPase [Betaproteobacteria bacterium]|nr:magnesium-translocating P-type ATPase [Betaproteobacteria bacterium]